MSVSLSFPTALYDDLLSHMRTGDTEQVSFLFTNPPEPNKPLRIIELSHIPPDQFDLQSAYHVTLADDVRAGVIGRAWQLGGCLVEAHSHGGSALASFSYSDVSGLSEWVPHVRWRLRGRTYVALVFAEASYDALAWEEGQDGPAPIAGVHVDGKGTVSPTGLSYRYIDEANRD